MKMKRATPGNTQTSFLNAWARTAKSSCIGLIILLLTLSASPLWAQQNVGVGTTTPDSSAALEIQSNSQGLLIPRMSSTARLAISSPAEGLLVYDNDLKAFYHYTNSAWVQLGSGGSSSELSDADNDTKILVEKTADDDIIRFELSGNEKMRLIQNASGNARLELFNNGSSLFIGNEAGYQNTTGTFNTFVGNGTGRQNTTGSYNSYYGYEAGQHNSTGRYNTFYGFRAGQQSRTGTNNTITGAEAGLYITHGSRNTFSGASSGYHNSHGNNNVFTGFHTGSSNTSGSDNTYTGLQAGYLNQTGNGNTFYGTYSGFSTTEHENTFIGKAAGYANTIGTQNVYLGYHAGYSATGSGNVFLGYQAGQNESGSNRLYIQNSGINSSGALIYGEFDNDLLALNATVGIGTTTPDASAALEIQSTSKGVLIPRMSTIQRQNISNPTEGLMVFDSTAHAFYYHNNSTWTKIGASDQLTDADGDTKIQVEETTDEDIIRFELSGNEKMRLIQNASGNARLELFNNGSSLFIGHAAGYQNTIGTFNTFVGNEAGRDNTTGTFNTFIGKAAGRDNTTGDYNTLYGFEAGLHNSTGQYNTFCGFRAGQQSRTGTNNTFTGAEAGYANTSGTQNVYLGYRAGFSATGSGNLFLGYRAGQDETGSNRLYIQNSDTNSSGALIYGEFDNDLLALNATVGIGTTTPDASAALEIQSASKGVLIPRMSTTQRQNISNPAEGLTVFDSTAHAFYYHTGSTWTRIAASGLLADADADTKIQVEKNADEDIIRFDLNGTEKMLLTQNTSGVARLEMPGNGRSVYIGEGAGALDDGNNRNTVALGYQAGASNKGSFNVFVGSEAGPRNNQGHRNTFSGYQAGYFNKGGSWNTFFGYQAGLSNTSGNKNAFFGSKAGHFNTVAPGNTFLGAGAGCFNIYGEYNTFCGNNAGYNNDIGLHNVFNGAYAGYLNITGHRNVYVGVQAGGFATGSNNVFLGYQAGLNETNSNRLYIQNSDTNSSGALIYGEFDNDLLAFNARVGIGTTQPNASAALDITAYGKGLLIPRMTSASRQSIPNPAKGLAVYDSTAHAFYYHTDSAWIRIGASNLLADGDGDTKIQVEKNADEDIIRFDLDGNEKMLLTQNTSGVARLEIPGNGRSTYIGEGAGAMDDGNNRNTVALGYQAGSSNASGYSNVFIGSEAGRDNNGGYQNTFTGHQAGSSNTTGFANVFNGAGAGLSNISGSRNTFSGFGAGASNTGDDNTFSGCLAGFNNTSGTDNVFMGMGAGLSNNLGSGNTFSGAHSGYSNTNGHSNTFYGFSSGHNNTASHNTFLGDSTGYENTSGSQNVYVGKKAGLQATGSGNVFLGYQAGQDESGSNRLYIENSDTHSSGALIYGEFDNDLLALNARVGIGTTQPDASAVLDLKSSNKGLLIPRMTSSFRQNINSPVEGLTVYDSTAHAFYYYNGSAWTELSADVNATVLQDTDADTKIQVEKTNDEDIIRFDLGGAEKIVLRQNAHGNARLEMLNNRSSVFIGDSAGYANSTGQENTFTGYRAGVRNTDGFGNTFSGNQAGKANTGGDLNSFYGSYAGAANTGGIQNTFSGAYSGVSNTTGIRNTFIGYQSGDKNTGGRDNTYMGYRAGSDNTSGILNVYLGTDAGAGSSGRENVYLGASAGVQSTGSGNVYLGYLAGAGFSGSNKLMIENSSTDSNNALIYGDFDKDILKLNASVGIGTSSSPKGLLEIQGAAPHAKLKIGGKGGDAHHISSDRDMVFNAVWRGQNTGRLFTWRSTDYDSLGNYSTRMFMSNEGNLYIGTGPNPNYNINCRLYVDGSACKSGDDSWSVASDRRLKRDINPYTDGLQKLLAIRPVTFRYNEASGFDTQPEYVGVIAQELREVAPYMVSGYPREGTEYLNVNNSAMTYMLINAVKEQQAFIRDLQESNRQLASELEDTRALKAELEALKTESKEVRQQVAQLNALRVRLEALEAQSKTETR